MPDQPQQLPTRDHLRQLALATRRAGFDSTLVEFVFDPTLQALRSARALEDATFERVTFEVRAPSIAERGRIMAASMKGVRDGQVIIDLGTLQKHALLELVLVPAVGADGLPKTGGSQRVFEPADLEQLGEALVGSHLDILGKLAQSLVNGEQVGKA